MLNPLKSFFVFLILFVSTLHPLRGAAQQAKPDPFQQAGAGDSLRKAFEKAIYSLKANGRGTWTGSNDAQRLGLEFDAAGAKLKHPDGTVGFHLVGVGYGDALKAPAAATIQADGTRLEYRRGDLTEWYVNGQHGLEQGFTLASRPAGAAPGQSLNLLLGITGNLALSQTDGYVLLKSKDKTILRYQGLSATDAMGRAVPAHMEAGNHEIRLIVDDEKAQYPLTVDPTWTQETEFLASDGIANANFGNSVGVSGTIAVIGTGGGKAYIFAQTGGFWSLQQELSSADEATYDGFGSSVAISGTTVLVGAPYHSLGNNGGQGEAYVFTQTGTTWSQQAELTASDGGVNDNFGVSVAINGTTAVIGAYNHQVGSNASQGAAYLFTQTGNTWSQQAEFIASDGQAYDGLGASVAVSGSTAVVGAFGRNDRQGVAYVFAQNGNSWSQQAELTASDGAAFDLFGYSVAVSGTTAVIGASAHTVNGQANQGSAYIFTQSGNTWSQQQELTASDGAANDSFAFSVAISGSMVVIGADGRKISANARQGVAYTFAQIGSTWSQQQELAASNGASGDAFGNSVAVSGSAIMVGAEGKSIGNNSQQGAAYLFTSQPTTPPFGNLELAVDATTGSSNVVENDSLFVSGWVADAVDGAPLSNVEVLVNGVPIRPTLGLPRPDVAAYFGNPAYANSGYRLVLPSCGGVSCLQTGRVGNATMAENRSGASSGNFGTYTVSVLATDSGGRSTTFGPLTFNFVAGPPVGNLESAVDANFGGSTVASTDSVSITGWVADPTDGAPLSNVKVSIDGAVVGTPTLGIGRPDVSLYYYSQNQGAYYASGYQLSYPASKLSVGPHSVTVTATDSGGRATTFGPLAFTVSATPPPAPPFGNLELAVDANNGSTTVSKTDALWVSGWVADTTDGAPLGSVAVSIDGTAVGSATTGISRPDVASYLGNTAYTKSGYQWAGGVSTLSAGYHYVTVTAVDKAGRSTTFGPLPILVTTN